MREYTEYRWRENDLYYGEEKCFTISPYEHYEGMFWLIRPNGEKVDFYNIQRAKDNARKLDQYEYNLNHRQTPPTEAVGAFK